MWYVWLSVFVAYLGMTWYSLVQSGSPSVACHRRGDDSSSMCYHPLIRLDDELTMELWLYQQPSNETKNFKWTPVTSCRLNVSLPQPATLPTLLTTNKTKCEVPIPDTARQRSTNKNHVKPLRAQFVFFLSKEDDSSKVVVARAPFELTRIKERRPKGFWPSSNSDDTATATPRARNLLEKPVPHMSSEAKKDADDRNSIMWIPYLKYGRAAVRLRFVAETRPYGSLDRQDGLQLPAWNQSTYGPMIYVDDLSLQRSAQVELAPPEDNKPPIQLQIKLGSLSPVFDSLNRQLHTAFKTIENILPGGGEEELDEIRYFLQDERLYRFALTQIISYIHIWFDYLAFRDEIRFYKGRQNNNLSGVATSTVITRLLCSVIILLYLLDGGGTSWVVLFSLSSSCAVEAWKVWKLLRPTFKPRFPFVAYRGRSAKEQETDEYDRVAIKYLAMVLYPLVIGWSLYALQHYEYKSWYSWFISNLANAVYTFGFISLCPQLYVNYRLKSVAHLPWKVFLYKIFNTFVDDIFAFLIEMPWKHRIMTLRDDVVFLIFLFQVYLYRVDKTRTNEFGYAYDDNPSADISLQDNTQTHQPLGTMICPSSQKDTLPHKEKLS